MPEVIYIRLIVIIVLLWSGMLLGISFLESWVKFRATTLTKAAGLDVGRTVFSFFHKVQCALLIMILFVNIYLKLPALNWLLVGILTTLFILQLAWLFPKLNQRVNIILAGEKLPTSYAHAVYGVFEITKLLILLVLAVQLMD